MKINHELTSIKCRLLNQAELARQCGVTPPLVNMIVKGTYSHMEGKKAQFVITRLRELGYLVEEPDADDQRIAA